MAEKGDDYGCLWFTLGTRHLGLTPREAEALWHYVNEGPGGRRRAARTGMARHTAYGHVANARAKLGLTYTAPMALVRALWPYAETARLLARYGPPGGAR